MDGHSDILRDVETQRFGVNFLTHQVNTASNSAPRALLWRWVKDGDEGEPIRVRRLSLMQDLDTV